MILGQNIRLRPLERDDLPRSVTWLADPEVREAIALFMPLSMEDETKWFEEMKKRDRELQIFAIDVRTRGVPSTAAPGPRAEGPLRAAQVQAVQGWLNIGSAGFHAIDWRVRAAEFGIMIGDKNYWSKGYGTDAVRTLAGFGFGELNLNRIYLRVFDYNRRAIRCYEKVGFVLEGRLRQGHFHDGRYCDVLLMGLLREEWKPQ